MPSAIRLPTARNCWCWTSNKALGFEEASCEARVVRYARLAFHLADAFVCFGRQARKAFEPEPLGAFGLRGDGFVERVAQCFRLFRRDMRRRDQRQSRR